MKTNKTNATLRQQVRQALHDNPNWEENNTGLVLAVWEKCGLKLRRKQVVPTFALPGGGTIIKMAEEIDREMTVAARKSASAATTSDPDPDFLTMENEPVESPKSKKISVKRK